MEQPAVVSLRDGATELYVIGWPVAEEEVQHGLCFVVMLRQGGALIAVPPGLVSVGALQGAEPITGITIGLHTTLVVPAVILQADGVQVVQQDLNVVVLDVSEGVLQLLTPYSTCEVQEEEILGFAEDLSLLPDPGELLRSVREWVEVVGQGGGDLTFYSAEEQGGATPPGPRAKQKAKATEKAKRSSPAAQVAEQIKALSGLLPVMSEQLTVLQEEQKRMQQFLEGQAITPPVRPSQVPVSMHPQAFAQMMGSPPRTKGMSLVAPPPKRPAAATPTFQGQLEEEEGMALEGNTLALAVLQQSKALTSLVSHLQQGGDPLLDHQGTSSSTSSRGAAGREKLQKELAERSGSFFLQVIQNAYRRMKPASPTPTSLADVAASDFSMIQYLERCGGYGGSKEMGLVMSQEHLSLLLVAVEQAVQDQGKWDLAFQLMLVEDPPRAMFTYGGGVAHTTGRVKAFSSLCPQRWATVALAYAKELDFIQSRRQEAAKKASVAPQQGPVAPNPKKKGKYPKSKANPEKAEEEAI